MTTAHGRFGSMVADDVADAEPVEFELVHHGEQDKGRAAAPPRSARHDPAPAAALRAPDGRPHRMAEFRGRNVVLHVFDKDRARAGRQARALQARLPEFAACNATVLGVAPVGPRAQRRFAAQNHVDFLLLADRDRAWMRRLGAAGEATVIIDADGRVDKVFAATGRPGQATARVLDHLRALHREETWDAAAPPPQ